MAPMTAATAPLSSSVAANAAGMDQPAFCISSAKLYAPSP